jgi:hypothetical protein
MGWASAFWRWADLIERSFSGRHGCGFSTYLWDKQWMEPLRDSLLFRSHQPTLEILPSINFDILESYPLSLSTLGAQHLEDFFTLNFQRFRTVFLAHMFQGVWYLKMCLQVYNGDGVA